MKTLADLTIKIFADGADKKNMLAMYQKPYIKGFTTNPTIMRQSGINDYAGFAIDILNYIQNLPISFEVFSDDFDEMYDQARLIASWGENVYVKIPITNTAGYTSCNLIESLAREQIKMNITALMTLAQIEETTQALARAPSSYISVFAGRIADTGRDPLPLMQRALEIMSSYQQLELLWASPRELLNIIQADDIGCHAITVTSDILKKLVLLGKDLSEYSLETVCMFRNDALKAQFSLKEAVV